MIENIISSYEALNAELLDNMHVNDIKTRDLITIKLTTELPDCDVKCDEENNPPEIVDACVAVARVSWVSLEIGSTYVDLVFGAPEQIMAVQPNLH